MLCLMGFLVMGDLVSLLLWWYDVLVCDLFWCVEYCIFWGVLVSEVML